MRSSTRDVTVTFHGQKVGLAGRPGRFHCGRGRGCRHRARAARDRARARRPDELLDLVPRRGHPGQQVHGRSVLVVGGSRGLTGAPCLAAEAAFRADAGYVAVAGPELDRAGRSSTGCSRRSSARSRRTTRSTRSGGGRHGARASARAGAVALGPGLGRGAGTKEVVRRLLARARRCRPSSTPTRSTSSSRCDWPAPRVLTPHAGELARLLGEESGWVDAHRLEAARPRASSDSAASSCSKGTDTLVGAPGEGVARLRAATPTLATAGTGDVLTGIVGAFLAKGMDARLAAAAAATAHTAAALEAPQQAGLIARDVMEALPVAARLAVHRSEITIDLGAVRRNARTLLRVLDGAELWAVVKADAYGHGAVDVARRSARRGRRARSASPRCRGARAAADEYRDGADPRHGADGRPTSRRRRGRPGSSSRSSTRRIPEGVAGRT